GNSNLVVGCLGYGVLGLLIAGLWDKVDVLSAILVLFPLIIARWVMSSTRTHREAHVATIAALHGGGEESKLQLTSPTIFRGLPDHTPQIGRASPWHWAAWRTTESGQLLLVVTAGMTVLAAITQVAAVRLIQPNVAIIFGVLIALGELFRMVMPGGREVAP